MRVPGRDHGIDSIVLLPPGAPGPGRTNTALAATESLRLVPSSQAISQRPQWWAASKTPPLATGFWPLSKAQAGRSKEATLSGHPDLVSGPRFGRRSVSARRLTECNRLTV